MRRHRLITACLVALFWGGIDLARAQSPRPDASDPEVQRRVAVVVLARRIRGYAAMAKANSDCLVDQGRLSAAQADRALVISLEELGISPTVLLNPLVKALSPRLQALLTQQCSLEPDQEATALKLTETEL